MSLCVAASFPRPSGVAFSPPRRFPTRVVVERPRHRLSICGITPSSSCSSSSSVSSSLASSSSSYASSSS
eukprot:1934220-Lingulodinium_polyedra.AAC.1